MNGLCEAFSAYNISKEMFYKGLAGAYDQEHIFRPSHFFRTLTKDIHIPNELFKKQLSSFCCSLYEYTYPDTLPFLRAIQPNHTPLLLTFGDKRFQRMKIEGAGFIPYFARVVVTNNITKDKEASELSGVEPTVYVDDNPVALTAAKRYAPHIVTVRIKRKEGEHMDKPSSKWVDYEITELAQLGKIIL